MTKTQFIGNYASRYNNEFKIGASRGLTACIKHVISVLNINVLL